MSKNVRRNFMNEKALVTTFFTKNQKREHYAHKVKMSNCLIFFGKVFLGFGFWTFLKMSKNGK